MKRVVLAMAFIIIGTLTGCDKNSTVVANTGPGINYVVELNWHGTVYYESNSISKVGSQIGTVEEKVTKPHLSKSNNTVSNFAPIGTKIFKVPGLSTSKAVAIEYPNGKYMEAFVNKNQ